MKRRIALFLAAALVVPGVFAQAKDVQARLEYADDPFQIVITNADGTKAEAPHFGDYFPLNARIRTNKTVAEIKLYPNMSVIKLSENTEITIKSLVGLNNATANNFEIFQGKLRVVAAKMATPAYTFKTPRAVAGVRGTDFGLEIVPGAVDKLIVRDGLVDFAKGETFDSPIKVGAGFAADALATDFSALKLSTQDMANFFKDMEFKVAKGPEVAEAIPNGQPTNEPGKDQTTGQGDGKDNGGDQNANAANDELWKSILNILGIEIGAVTLDGQTYGKFLLQPKIKVGLFKAAFYLPVVYKNNLFDPTTWYRPAGNNEWSFGTDQGTDVGSIIKDILQDLALKIRYVEVADQGDPFFLKIGNISSMTLGHGMLINGYANDGEFPAVRRIGVNVGLGPVELLTNDLANPQIFGFRLLIQPIKDYKGGIALSLASDVSPSSAVPASTTDTLLLATKFYDPIISFIGLDIDIPIIQQKSPDDLFTIRAFTDFATMLPYIRNSSSSIHGGFFPESIAVLGSSGFSFDFRNIGWTLGVDGKVAFMKYKVQFQYAKGAFKVGYVGQDYDRNRAYEAADVLVSLANINGSLFNQEKMGIYGKAGFQLFDAIDFNIGYLWPWSGNLGSIVMENPDSFDISITSRPKALPLKLDIGLLYQRSHFYELFQSKTTYAFMDQYATIKGLIGLPVSDFFKIRISVGSSIKRTSTGAIDMSAGHPTIYPVVNIETLLGPQ